MRRKEKKTANIEKKRKTGQKALPQKEKQRKNGKKQKTAVFPLKSLMRKGKNGKNMENQEKQKKRAEKPCGIRLFSKKTAVLEKSVKKRRKALRRLRF